MSKAGYLTKRGHVRKVRGLRCGLWIGHNPHLCDPGWDVFVWQCAAAVVERAMV